MHVEGADVDGDGYGGENGRPGEEVSHQLSLCHLPVPNHLPEVPSQDAHPKQHGEDPKVTHTGRKASIYCVRNYTDLILTILGLHLHTNGTVHVYP